MRLFKPDYYDSFKCTGGGCKHNCCIGWEIDIDEDSLEEYVNVPGQFGDRLRQSISLTDESPHFILSENGRCPFLTKENLCDIIINMGEESLCQICSDHPRFVNYISDREEIGLGMCCEEAARLILTKKEKTVLLGEKKEEERIVHLRDTVIEMLQDRGYTIDERMANVMKAFKLKMPKRKWRELYLSLERLDEKWTDRLKSLERGKTPLKEDWSVPFEQLLVYFIYRHMSQGTLDTRYGERILFSFLSFYMIREIFGRSREEMAELIEICRMYSSEVEYSEENVEEILTNLK